MPAEHPAPPPPALRGPIVLLAAAALGAALAVGALRLSERLRAPAEARRDGPPAVEPPRAAPPVAPSAAPAAALAWRCPMHPHVARDRPGTCPICGMRLVRTESDADAVRAGPGGGAPAR